MKIKENEKYNGQQVRKYPCIENRQIEYNTKK